MKDQKAGGRLLYAGMSDVDAVIGVYLLTVHPKAFRVIGQRNRGLIFVRRLFDSSVSRTQVGQKYPSSKYF